MQEKLRKYMEVLMTLKSREKMILRETIVLSLYVQLCPKKLFDTTLQCRYLDGFI